MAALEGLARRADFRVAIVSGRRLDDLRARCPVAGCWYVGGHGNETEEAEAAANAAHPDFVAARRDIAGLTEEIRARLRGWPGARIETKPYSVAVHFREAPEWGEAIREAFAGLAARDQRFRVMYGRQVAELLPAASLTKGHAVQRLRSRLGCDLAFYFGDDISDEDVFGLGDPDVLGIKVDHREGPTDTAADFRLKSPQAVVQALELIARERPAPEAKRKLSFRHRSA